MYGEFTFFLSLLFFVAFVGADYGNFKTWNTHFFFAVFQVILLWRNMKGNIYQNIIVSYYLLSMAGPCVYKINKSELKRPHRNGLVKQKIGM